MKKKTVKKQVVKLTEKELTKVVGGRGVSSRMSKNKFAHDIYKRIFKWK
ncbi:bacteriocin [Lactobacillus sp. LL6]|nr:bacteriocin [Lactobacillus sp. LL6]TSO26893.1 ComC/BlpC family leader-containing pheromone/bacteriocin [Lactobacillus sp. LL6]